LNIKILQISNHLLGDLSFSLSLSCVIVGAAGVGGSMLLAIELD